MALTSTFTDCATVVERASMVVMINRLHRSPRTLSVTSPARVSLLTCGFTLGLLAVATLNTPVAAADPVDICDPSDPYYIGGALCDDASTTTAPSSGGSGGSGGGIGDAFSSFFDSYGALLFFGGLIAFIVWVIIATRRDSAEEKAEKRAAELARGRQIALDAGVEPAAQSPEDLRRYSTFQWAVPWTHGTAFGQLVDRDGGTGRVHAAWTAACELARLGHWTEAGVFIPAATVVNVNGYSDGSGDLELSVNTRDYTVGERELNRVLEPLTRTARVETATSFTRDAVRDWHVTRLSMNPAQQQAAAPEQEASAPDPTTAWEW